MAHRGGDSNGHPGERAGDRWRSQIVSHQSFGFVPTRAGDPILGCLGRGRRGQRRGVEQGHQMRAGLERPIEAGERCFSCIALWVAMPVRTHDYFRDTLSYDWSSL